ncbi:MAG: hypothetical protein IT424_15330, partial [Pirellulales bacterium]|nr:hypothetical protein [Pirellulales bacterium]
QTNRTNLQKAIDWASPAGAALFVEPSAEPSRIASGIVLKKNVSLLGVHGPVGRGTSHPTRSQPVGSVLACEDDQAPFITVEGATQIRGIQFWYPKQHLRDPQQVVAYPPTIKASPTSIALGVTLSCLTFYGEYFAMDFRCTPQVICEQVLIEHCYGYPLSGQFVAIDYCYDIPRVLHCHVNPANMRLFGGHFSRDVIDATVAKGTFAYWIDHTDNAVMIDLFTFATYGGVYLGPATYGQLTSFNLDCVAVGVHKLGDGTFNRNWQLAQGSIIANIGSRVEEVHPVIIEGKGHTSLTNVECFSGPNGAVTAIGKSHDFLLVRGSDRPTISLIGCRMRNYAADNPITVENPAALIQATACVDKNEQPFNLQPAQ